MAFNQPARIRLVLRAIAEVARVFTTMLRLVIDDFETMPETRLRIADDGLDEGLSTKRIVCSTNTIIAIAPSHQRH